MFKLLVRLLKAIRCKVFICCKSKCSLGDNDEITIENLNISIETPEPLESLDSDDVKNLVEDKLIPAFNELAFVGIKTR